MLTLHCTRKLCLAAVVTWLAGTAPAHAIVYGDDAPPTPEARATVLVGSGCSGTLVAADLVLTAGHCVDREDEPPSGDVTFREGEPDWQRPDRFYSIGARTITVGTRPSAPSSFTTRAREYAIPGLADMILLRLDDAVPPEHATPVEILTDIANPQAWLRGKTFEIAGFGDDDEDDGVIEPADHLNEGMVDRAVFPCPRGSDGWMYGGPHKLCVKSADGSGTRRHDSGGPLYWRNASGRRMLVGVYQGRENYIDGRYTATFYRGGSTGDDGRSLSNIGGWLEQHVRRSKGGTAYLTTTSATPDRYVASATNPTGLTAEVRQMGTGLYRAIFEGLRPPRAAIVTAYGVDASYCKLLDASRAHRVGVTCFDSTGRLTNSAFSVLTDDRAGDVLARVDSTGMTLHGPVSVTRSSAGVYIVRRSVAGPDWSNVLVSAEGVDAVRCHVRAYTATTATIGCVSPAGVRTDSGFSFAATNAGTHVDADEPTTPRYVMASGATVERLERGRYRVSSPDPLTSNTQITAVTATSRHCKLRSRWADSIGVDCYDQTGAFADTRFMARVVDVIDRSRRVRVELNDIWPSGPTDCPGIDLSGRLRFVSGATGSASIPLVVGAWERHFYWPAPLAITANTASGVRFVDVELALENAFCPTPGYDADIAPSIYQRNLRLRLDLQAHTVQTLDSTTPVLGTFGRWTSDGSHATITGKVRLNVIVD